MEKLTKEELVILSAVAILLDDLGVDKPIPEGLTDDVVDVVFDPVFPNTDEGEEAFTNTALEIYSKLANKLV